MSASVRGYPFLFISIVAWIFCLGNGDAETTKFLINTKSDHVEVESGSNLLFECQAEGMPRPNISLEAQGSAKNLTGQVKHIDSNTTSFELTEKAECGGSGVYVCKSENGGAESEKSVTVKITKCPPMLKTQPDGSPTPAQTVTQNGVGLFHVKFDVISDPLPTDWKLFKISTSQRRRRSGSPQTELDKKYYVLATETGDAMYSQVSLDVFDPSPRNQTQYKLELGNGIGSELEIHFTTEIHLDKHNDDSKEKVKEMIAVGIVACGLVIFLVVGTVCLLTWSSNAKAKRKAKEAKLRHRQEIVSIQELD